MRHQDFGCDLVAESLDVVHFIIGAFLGIGIRDATLADPQVYQFVSKREHLSASTRLRPPSILGILAKSPFVLY